MDLIALAAAVCVMGAIVCGDGCLYQATASPRSGMERRLGASSARQPRTRSAVAQMQGLRPKRAGAVPDHQLPPRRQRLDSGNGIAGSNAPT